MKNPVLNFLLLILKIPLNLSLDADYKRNRFFKILTKKSFEFVSSRRDKTVVLNLSFMLLPAEIDLILKKQGCERVSLLARGTGCIEIVLVLLTKVVTVYV